MKNKMLWLVIGAIVVIIVLILIPSKPKENIIKIGAILPLTGTGAFSGEQTRDGMLIAVDEINNAGGINGRRIELLVEDSKTNPQEGVTAFNNMISLKNPSIIISSLSSVSAALVPLAKENEIPLLTTIASAPDLPKNEWTFRYYPTSEQEIPPIVKIADDFKIKKMGILYMNDDLGVSMYTTLKKEFKGDVIGESFPTTTGDFRTQLNKLKEQNVDGILVIGFSSHITNSIKQIKELGLNVKIFTASTAAFPDVRKALNEMGVEVYAGVPKFYSAEANEEAKIFKAKFEDKYKKEADHYAGTGYDLIKLTETVISSGGYSKEEIKNSLTNLKGFNGVLGSASINGREISFPLYPARIKNGEIIYL